MSLILRGWASAQQGEFEERHLRDGWTAWRRSAPPAVYCISPTPWTSGGSVPEE
jgi:hypothetical protein